MITLKPGTYSRKQMLAMDFGANQLPSTKIDIIISQPKHLDSYRIFKIRVPVQNRNLYDHNCYAYRIEVI